MGQLVYRVKSEPSRKQFQHPDRKLQNKISISVIDVDPDGSVEATISDTKKTPPYRWSDITMRIGNAAG